MVKKDKVRLGDVCTIISGTTPKTGIKEYWDGELNWITPAELNDDIDIIYKTERKITNKAVTDSSLKLLPVGTVLLSSRAPIGKVAIVGSPMYCNQGFKNLICSNSIFNKFLYWFLKGKKDFLNSLGRGATFKEISKSIVEDIQILLPPLSEQKRIASILDKATELIALRKQQIEKLDLLVKSRFIEMFGNDQEFNRWSCCKIANVADITVGVVIKPAQYYTNCGIPAFRSLNIGEMVVRDKEWVFFTPEGHAKNKKSIIQENDILVIRSGAPGVACVATKKYAGYNAIDIIIARPNINKVNPIFLAMFTNLPHGMNQIRNKTGGAAQQHFNIGSYKGLDLILPPLHLQNEFAAFVEQVEKTKSTLQQSLEKLELNYKALMQTYFG